MLKFTQFCNILRALGKISVFKNRSLGILITDAIQVVILILNLKNRLNRKQLFALKLFVSDQST